MKQTILFKHPAPVYREALKDDFDVVDFDLEAGTPSDDIRRTAKVLVTSGSYGAYADEFDALPGLELVCCVGTGYDRVDLDACRARGIRVTHSAGTNAEGVADHAIALLLAALRDIPRYDAQARSGAWRPPTDTRPTANGRSRRLDVAMPAGDEQPPTVLICLINVLLCPGSTPQFGLPFRCPPKFLACPGKFVVELDATICNGPAQLHIVQTA